MGAVATHAINPWLFANLPYDPVKDFAPVTIVASVPNVLVMNVEFAAKNKIEKLADLIDYAKKNPGKLNYGSGGNGSAGHLSGELLKARAGINVEHIPYQGAAPDVYKRQPGGRCKAVCADARPRASAARDGFRPAWRIRRPRPGRAAVCGRRGTVCGQAWRGGSAGWKAWAKVASGGGRGRGGRCRGGSAVSCCVHPFRPPIP